MIRLTFLAKVEVACPGSMSTFRSPPRTRYPYYRQSLKLYAQPDLAFPPRQNLRGLAKWRWLAW
jgi:hypothetical protein